MHKCVSKDVRSVHFTVGEKEKRETNIAPKSVAFLSAASADQTRKQHVRCRKENRHCASYRKCCSEAPAEKWARSAAEACELSRMAQPPVSQCVRGALTELRVSRSLSLLSVHCDCGVPLDLRRKQRPYLLSRSAFCGTLAFRTWSATESLPFCCFLGRFG